MRILNVWLTAVLLLFSITVGWYISQDLVLNIAHNMLAGVTGKASTTLALVEWMNILWGPLFDLLVVIWAIVSSQRDDPTSIMGR